MTTYILKSTIFSVCIFCSNLHIQNFAIVSGLISKPFQVFLLSLWSISLFLLESSLLFFNHFSFKFSFIFYFHNIFYKNYFYFDNNTRVPPLLFCIFVFLVITQGSYLGYENGFLITTFCYYTNHFINLWFFFKNFSCF